MCHDHTPLNGEASVTVHIGGSECVAVTVGIGVAITKLLLILFYGHSASEAALQMMRVDDNMKCLLVAMCVVNAASF